MDINDYQQRAKATAIYPKEQAIDYLVLGLLSEAGEVAGKWKKKIRDNKFDEDAFIDELADCHWYLAMIAEELGVDSSVLLSRNLDKLYSRKERGVLSGSGDDR